MRHEKTWLVTGELTMDELSWLYQSRIEYHVERNEIHFTTIGGSHSSVTMPDVTRITLKTYNDKKETMMMLRMGDKVSLIEENFYSEEHGTYINF